ncbi:Uncharacterised protein [Shigella sonnei]|nr:Uncharacterised protein [Shigella sonnei]CSG63849.1 Uncharacterised protein [Shigella sonnei]CSI20654.1 Uncharacterised protein [Shigella sonnei]CSP50774.1 Uncharacterised protein [Shigella sonnei]CSQ47140.1 Uncharacterised protein [Shigella sonnei]
MQIISGNALNIPFNGGIIINIYPGTFIRLIFSVHFICLVLIEYKPANAKIGILLER